MKTTKQSRSIYLDDEIELLEKSLLHPKSKVYESEKPMRKRGNGVKTCGKTVYRDLDEAKNALFLIRVIRSSQEAQGINSRRREKRYYFCNRCHALHITSQEDRFAVGVSIVKAS
jgi:hypothetical protein